MKKQTSRRTVLKKSAVAAGGLAAARYVASPAIVSAQALKDKLRVVLIGCGGQGTSTHIPNIVRSELLVGVVDVDPKKSDGAIKRAVKEDANFDGSKVQIFNDYRKLFDQAKNDFDVVHVATPNHHHALPALIAMSLGKHCYVEKPLAHDIAECRRMAEFAAKYKVTTQMGNQGRSGDGYRRFCEYIWAGAIGNVIEVLCFTDRSNGGVGGRPPVLPVPAGMNWDAWIGPAPYRDYHKDLHPHEWHNWFDFGNGSPGNMACHVMDGAYWALKLGAPTSIEVEEMGGGSDEQYPTGTRIRWDFPARGDMGPVKVRWYDGKKKGLGAVGQGDIIGSVDPKSRNRPAIVEEYERIYSRNFGGDGSFYCGEKGFMHTGCYGETIRMLPEGAHKAFTPPPETIPRWKGTHFTNFYSSIRTKTPANSDFSYAAKFTEMILLGNLAVHAGLGQKIEWDGDKCTNKPELNKYLSREYRPGWTV